MVNGTCAWDQGAASVGRCQRLHGIKGKASARGPPKETLTCVVAALLIVVSALHDVEDGAVLAPVPLGWAPAACRGGESKGGRGQCLCAIDFCPTWFVGCT